MSDTDTHWHTLCVLWTQVWVRPCSWHTVSRRLKSTLSLTAFLPRLHSYSGPHCLLFCPVKMGDELHQAEYFLSHWLDYFLSVCHVSQPPSHSRFLVFFCWVSNVVLPSLTTTCPLYAICHSFHISFYSHFAHSLAHAAAQLCQTHVVRLKGP